jgi:HD-GYP domain-containing protein (c-di-GMP phosphodiesterase class II)
VNSSILINICHLRVGMYIQLDVGWMHHPFPVSSFRVASEGQISTLRELGLTEVRYVPRKSDPELRGGVLPLGAVSESGVPDALQHKRLASDAQVIQGQDAAMRREVLEAQNRELAACNERFNDATLHYATLERVVAQEPDKARTTAQTLVSECVRDMLENGDSVIRLLSEGVGERTALHPVNVMVIALLLGRALGIKGSELQDLGIAALVHDLGKLNLPAHVAQFNPAMSAADRMRYESHVGESVAFAARMGLSDQVLIAIAQHHETADGEGFPLRLMAEDLSRAGQVLALVNQYDRMCNPPPMVEALTPHEALSVIFAQHKSRFDPVVLGAFIRMMGVYPPGSIVQLVNDRFAIVASVNSTRPLRPKVIVHDPAVPKNEATVLDLELFPELGIRRSLKPAQLPRDALDYLSPRQRICYFFERAVHAGPDEADV